MAAPAQPAQVVGSERPEHRRRAQRPSDIYRQAVADLIGALSYRLRNQFSAASTREIVADLLSCYPYHHLMNLFRSQ